MGYAPQIIRDSAAYLIAPILRLTGMRFSKKHRQTEDWVYRLVSTAKANIAAGG